MTRRRRLIQEDPDHQAPTPLRLGISACLLGQLVRYDGRHKREPFLADALGRHVEWVPVCPEVELGLGVPREPIQLEGDAERPRLVGVTSRTDHTDRMARFGEARVAELAAGDLCGYVLKKDSPSCGMAVVSVHRPGRRPARRGVGLFAQALSERLPLLPVEEEDRLRDPALREAFIERVLAFARWRRAVERGMTRPGLAAFHAAHGLLLQAHHPAAYRRLDRLIRASAGAPLGALVAGYVAAFMRALRIPATRGRHAGVLGLILARVASRLTAAERRQTRAAIARYRRGLVALAVPLERLRRQVERLGDADLRADAYLDPHPLRAERG